MAYIKTNWQDGVTPLSASNLNKLENAVESVEVIAESGGDHAGVIGNPHGTTKGDVGLGSVPDYASASQAEAEAGTANDRLMTPLRTHQATTSAYDASFLTWVANINADTLDASFGKNISMYVKRLGYQLALYAWFKGTDITTNPFINLMKHDTMDEINSDVLAVEEIFTNIHLFDLIVKSPYVGNVLFGDISNKTTLVSDMLRNQTFASKLLGKTNVLDSLNNQQSLIVLPDLPLYVSGNQYNGTTGGWNGGVTYTVGTSTLTGRTTASGSPVGYVQTNNNIYPCGYRFVKLRFSGGGYYGGTPTVTVGGHSLGVTTTDYNTQAVKAMFSTFLGNPSLTNVARGQVSASNWSDSRNYGEVVLTKIILSSNDSTSF